MKTAWHDTQQMRQKEVVAPLSLIVSAFAKISDARKTLTPQLCTDKGETGLILIDLGKGRNRLGGSALAQVYAQSGSDAPDLENPAQLKAFFDAIQILNSRGLLLAYHDRSDGGLFATLCEMAFAGHCGISITLDPLISGMADDADEQVLSVLFNEELGAVIQIGARHHDAVMAVLADAGLQQVSHVIGSPNQRDQQDNRQDVIRLMCGNKVVFQEERAVLQRLWSETSFHMQKLRDHPECARQEFDRILDTDDPGLYAQLTFSLTDPVFVPNLLVSRPAVAVLREQGVNGHVEMAAAFDRAGFDAVDVHMSDILSGRVALSEFKGLIAGGGFSYGDVLGAGRGWAQSILFNDRARDEFAAFFSRTDTFALGVCNGCQMMSHLQAIIPGTAHWPRFGRNRSEQFEARFVMVRIGNSPSLFFDGMTGSAMPVTVAHGEGYAQFRDNEQLLAARAYVALQFVDNRGVLTETYPLNPNGSPAGITGLTSTDGRVTILMPHPERIFRTVQHSWHPDDWPEDSPWMRMFRNARKWVD